MAKISRDLPTFTSTTSKRYFYIAIMGLSQIREDAVLFGVRFAPNKGEILDDNQLLIHIPAKAMGRVGCQ